MVRCTARGGCARIASCKAAEEKTPTSPRPSPPPGAEREGKPARPKILPPFAKWDRKMWERTALRASGTLAQSILLDPA